MKILDQKTTNTTTTYKIAAENSDLEHYRQAVASNLSSTVKVPGFRPSKAPTDMILKYADQNTLQNDFLNHAVNDLYSDSQKTLNLRIVGEPKIEITKFVPFSSLEIKVEVPIIKSVKLPDYKHIKLIKQKTTVSKELLDQNITELQKRSAKLKPVKRAAKQGDLVVIDFEGSDSKTKEALAPASAKDFRLIIGEKTLIPGFEDKLVGLTTGKSKTFELTFPKDYPEKTFAGRKVTFKTTIKEVNSVSLPKLDDSFAQSVGSFKTFQELKEELTKQLQAEIDRQAIVDIENQILNFLAENVEVELDERLIETEYNLLLNNAKQAAINRGQTWSEFLASRSETEEDYQKELKKVAITRIKGGLAIGEIAANEGINITDSELTQHIVNLKSHYNDPAMQAELENPANRRELGSRLLTEKVLDHIRLLQPGKK
ncbi:MAG: trigger factor [Candidatus Saccharimonadales bacterium]